jgi:hypothetical protein
MAPNWRLDVIKQGPRLLTAAREAMGDENEAHLFVHHVISGALKDMRGPMSGRELDASLNRVLRAHAGEWASMSDSMKT